MTVTLESTADVAAAMAALDRVDTVGTTVADDRTVRARVQHGPTVVPVALQALESAGLRVSAVSVARPSLDDVYLRYTGRSFERAEREGEQS